MPEYQGRVSNGSAAGDSSGMKPSPMQTKVTGTAKPLSYPQMAPTYQDVGNFVHQHSHQSARPFNYAPIHIAHEFEFFVERSIHAMLSGAPFSTADLLRRFLTSTLKAHRHGSILRCDILLVHRCGK